MSKKTLSDVRSLLQNGDSVDTLSSVVQEDIFHDACREDDIIIVRALLESGCSIRKLHRADLLYLVDKLSEHETNALLRLACHDDNVLAVETLLKSGCRLSILSLQERSKLLRHTCCEDGVFVAHTLFENGCSAKWLSSEGKEELLYHASREGDMLVVWILLQNECSVSILSREVQEELLLHACQKSEMGIVRSLLKTGCRFSKLSQAQLYNILKHLSMQEKEELLHHACHDSSVFVAQTLLMDGCNISILSREEQEALLLRACFEGDTFVTESLITDGCNVDCVSADGYTPLMNAARRNHSEVVKKLILTGASVRIQTVEGNTVLHYAAMYDYIQCGILLAEGGASLRTRNKHSQAPLEMASINFQEAIKQTLSFTTRKTLCIIGNAEGGKSTLIASLKAESNTAIGKMVNRLRRVDDIRRRTAGIETVPHCSQRYGEVLFFDFAGQHEYHGPHQMFLESLLSKPGVSMTLLLVVKATEEEEPMLHQLHRWLYPVALMATAASPPHVIIVGSFLDKVKSKDEAIAKLTKCIKVTKEDLEKEFPIEFVGSCFLNCRKPQSEGIDQLCRFLHEIPIPEFRATHTKYSLALVLSQIRSSCMGQAVQLLEFSKWTQDNRDNLPQTMPLPEEVCQDLSAAGHALYLPNKEDPPTSWLVLDLPSILHKVYGTLFSQSKKIVNDFGLLHQHDLCLLFSHLDQKLVQQLLISLEFCIPVDPSVLKVEVSELTQSAKASGWLFFPALISAKPPQPISKGLHEQNIHYLCWQLRTSKKHSISARVLQTVLLRLAAHFVVKRRDEDGIQQHCCSIWWNGIEWQSKKGIDVTIHIMNNRVIRLVIASETDAGKSCQYMTAIISDILSTVHQLSPKLAAATYIVHPQKKVALYEDVTSAPPQDLFPAADIRNSIIDNEEYSLSQMDIDNRSAKALVSDLFGGYIPPLGDIERIIWPLSESNQPQSPIKASQADVLLQEVIICERHLILFRTYVSRNSAGKGRAVLEGLGFTTETIDACYGRHPLNEEHAIQDGLSRWAEGHHGCTPPTWKMLIDAMVYACIGQQHCHWLREELYRTLSAHDLSSTRDKADTDELVATPDESN